jgi:hypothetical protein
MSTLPPAREPEDERPLELEDEGGAPEALPRRATVGDLGSGKRLGSLGQSARGSQLRQARTILIVIGVLTALVNGGMMAAAPRLVHEAVQKEVEAIRARGEEVDMEGVAEAEKGLVRQNYLFMGAGVAIGILFIAFGLFVERAPVPITIASLVIYIGSMGVYGMLDPSTLARGLLIKLIVIGALFKSVQAALATERERRAEWVPNE